MEKPSSLISIKKQSPCHETGGRGVHCGQKMGLVFPGNPAYYRLPIIPSCDQARFSKGGGTAFRENFSLQLTFAVVTMRMPSVMIAPIVIVRPVSPSKKKL